MCTLIRVHSCSGLGSIQRRALWSRHACSLAKTDAEAVEAWHALPFCPWLAQSPFFQQPGPPARGSTFHIYYQLRKYATGVITAASAFNLSHLCSLDFLFLTMYVHISAGTCGNRKMALDFLEPELQPGVSLLIWVLEPELLSFPTVVSLFLFLFFSRDRVSLCSPGCPGTHSVDQAGFRNPPASAS